MSPLNEFLKGYFTGMMEAVQWVQREANTLGNELGRISLFLLVFVACLVTARGIWLAGYRIAGMVKGKKT